MEELRILYLEDSQQDAELAGYILKNAGIDFSFKLVDTQDEYEEALSAFHPDIILADHSLFHFNSLEALRIFKSKDMKIPFILVTGTVSEEFAVNILKQGADDYLLKDNLVRLPNAIMNSLEKYQLDRQRQKYLDNIISNEALMKEAEQLAQFGSWEADINTGEVNWSEGIFRIFGYTPGEIKPGHDILLYHIHPEDRHIFQALYSGMGDQDIAGSEIRTVDKNKDEKTVYFKVVVKRDKEGNLSRLIGFMQDITEKRKLEKELAEQALRQQKLITEVTIQAQEKERNELGRELHDNINQVLATIKMFLGMSLENAQKRDGLVHRSINNVEYAIEEIRKLSKSLVAPSLGDIGLVNALQELVKDINMSDRLNVSLTAEIEGEERIGKNMELMIYRIAQEQLTNIRKYAKADKAEITLRAADHHLDLRIADNGVGFDVTGKAQGIGLKNIRSRVNFYAGRMDIVSAPGKGCTLDISVPI